MGNSQPRWGKRMLSLWRLKEKSKSRKINCHILYMIYSKEQVIHCHREMRLLFWNKNNDLDSFNYPTNTPPMNTEKSIVDKTSMCHLPQYFYSRAEKANNESKLNGKL